MITKQHDIIIRYIFSFQIPSWILNLMSGNHFLHVLSSSLNLVIITITGTRFRNTLLITLGLKQEEGVGQTNIRLSTGRGLQSLEMKCPSKEPYSGRDSVRV